MDCFPELQILICEFSQISLNQKKEISEMGFSFLLPAPLHPPCAMRSSWYLLSPLSRAEQSSKAENHICDLCVSLILCATPTPLNPLNLKKSLHIARYFHSKGGRHLARSGGNAQKEIPYGIFFLFYISYNKGREEAVRDGYRRYISGREERSL